MKNSIIILSFILLSPLSFASSTKQKNAVKEVNTRVENHYYPFRFSFQYTLRKELIKFAKQGSCHSFKAIADSYYRLNKDQTVLRGAAQKKAYIAKKYSFIDSTHREYLQFKKAVKSEMKSIKSLNLTYGEDYYRTMVLMAKIMSPKWKIKNLKKLSEYDMFRLELGLDLHEKEVFPTMKTVFLAKESLLLLKLANVINVFGGRLFSDFERFFFSKETDVKQMFTKAEKDCGKIVKEMNNVMMLTTRLYREEINIAHKNKKIKYTHNQTMKKACKYKKEYPLICKGYTDFVKYQKSRAHLLGKPGQRIDWAHIDWDHLLRKFDPTNILSLPMQSKNTKKSNNTLK